MVGQIAVGGIIPGSSAAPLASSVGTSIAPAAPVVQSARPAALSSTAGTVPSRRDSVPVVVAGSPHYRNWAQIIDCPSSPRKVGIDLRRGTSWEPLAA